MDGRLRVVVADPRRRRVESDEGYWVVSAERPDAVSRVLARAGRPRDAWDALDGVAEDAVVVHVSTRGGGAHAVDAFRSVTATRELYVLRASNGDAVVTDHFRSALSHLDVADRTVTRAAVADHLLFRAPVEPETYVSRIDALGHGTWLHWSLCDDERTRTQASRLVGRDGASTPSPGETPAAVGRTLDGLLDDVCGDAAVTTMLSGGVDSTLLATYRADDPTLVVELDGPELAFEREYADRAASLLGADPRRVGLDESAYLDHLETSVDRLGFPSHYRQTAVLDAAFARDDAATDAYLNGEGADALFGMTGAKGLRVATWLDSVLTSVPDRVADLAPSAVGDPLSALQRIAVQTRRHPGDPDSFAVRFPFFTDPDVVASMVGRETVRRRVRAQYDYLTRRVDPDGGDAFSTHAAYGHLYAYLRHNTGGQWRQLAYAHGKTMFYPFRCARLARLGLAVPASRRYVQGLDAVGDLESKHLLKSLLAERCPGYPVGQRKGSGALPVERYFETGPLAPVFDRYDPPAFVPESMYSDHVDAYGPVTWNLVTYAVWRDRVLDDPSLEPVATARTWTWPVVGRTRGAVDGADRPDRIS